MPTDEADRLADLHDLHILDQPPPPILQRLADLTRDLLDAPIAAVALIAADREQLLARTGPIPRDRPRDAALARHALDSPATHVAPDTWADARLRDHPLVVGPPGVRFYIGAPILLPSGSAIGALVAMDVRPRAPTEQDVRRIEALAGLVRDVLDMRRNILVAREIADEAASRTDGEGRSDSRRFARISHDMRTPLGHILGFAELLRGAGDRPVAEEERSDYLDIIRSSGEELMRLLDGAIEDERRKSRARGRSAEPIDLRALLPDIVRAFSGEAAARGQRLAFVDATDRAQPCRARVDAVALRRVVNNLIDNACAHAGEGAQIDAVLSLPGDGLGLLVEVRDDGPGVPDRILARLGRPFVQGGPDGDGGPDGAAGAGLGLSNVVEIADANGWDFALTRRSAGGAAARLRLPRPTDPRLST